MNESLVLKSENKLKNTFSVDTMTNIQNNLNDKIKIEKIFKEICTYIDIKFKEQEHIIKKIMEIKDPNLNTIETSVQEQQNKTFFEEKTKSFIRMMALIILNFLIVWAVALIIMWTSFYINSYEFNLTNHEMIGDTNAHYMGEEIINWILTRSVRFLLLLMIQFISTYLLIKNSYFPPSSPPNDESPTEIDYDEIFSLLKEKLEDNIKIQDFLDNVENFLDKLKNENLQYLDIIDRWSSENSNIENTLANMEADTQRILAELESKDLRSSPKEEGVESTNNVPDPNDKDKIFDLGRSLKISASILGSSIVLSNIIPTLLEIFLK